MGKDLTYFRTLINLVERTESQKKRLDELQKEVERLAHIILIQQEQIHHNAQVSEERDRRVVLEAENLLLKFERRLPPQP